MVTELCDGGELRELVERNKCLTEEQTRHIIRSLAEAIVYLHKKGNDIPQVDFLTAFKGDFTFLPPLVTINCGSSDSGLL